MLHIKADEDDNTHAFNPAHPYQAGISFLHVLPGMPRSFKAGGPLGGHGQDIYAHLRRRWLYVIATNNRVCSMSSTFLLDWCKI